MRKTISALVVMSFVALLYAFAAPAQNSDWKQLFNGKDLTGWKHVGPGGMTVEEGLMKTHGGMGRTYWTGGKIGKCKLRVVFKIRDFNDNSRVYLPHSSEPRETTMTGLYPYSVHVD